MAPRLKAALDGQFPSRKTGAIIPDDPFDERSSLASVRPKGVVAPGASDRQIKANSRANECSSQSTTHCRVFCSPDLKPCVRGASTSFGPRALPDPSP